MANLPIRKTGAQRGGGHGRDSLRRILIHDQDGRDAVASQLLRYRDRHGDWADIIDMVMMHPEARRRVVRLLGEIEAGTSQRASVSRIGENLLSGH